MKDTTRGEHGQILDRIRKQAKRMQKFGSTEHIPAQCGEILNPRREQQLPSLQARGRGLF